MKLADNGFMLEVFHISSPLLEYRLKGGDFKGRVTRNPGRAGARGAQAFAITLEKPGGSTAPEGPMYVLGKV